MLNRPLSLLLVIGLGLLLLWSQRDRAASEVTRTALIMGTLVEIKAVGSDENKLEDAINNAFDVMRRVEAEFSPQVPNSAIARLNQTAETSEIPSSVRDLVELGEQVRLESNGAFSMALGGVKELWAIETENPQVPTREQLEAVLPPLDSPALLLDGLIARRSSTLVRLDLGGIAKGYAVDRALEQLRDRGLRSASVNAGGDIGVLGGHAERPWRIGIQHPRKQGELLATLEARDQAIVTSGDYERYFERDGRRYHHIFDPRSGQPASGCQSVSVVAPSAALADALATAVFVLGPEAGMRLLEQRSEAEGLIVAANGEAIVSSGLKERLQWR